MKTILYRTSGDPIEPFEEWTTLENTWKIRKLRNESFDFWKERRNLIEKYPERFRKYEDVQTFSLSEEFIHKYNRVVLEFKPDYLSAEEPLCLHIEIYDDWRE